RGCRERNEGRWRTTCDAQCNLHTNEGNPLITRTYQRRLAGSVAAIALLTAACGDSLEGETNGDGGDVQAGSESLDGAAITVGSKDFDEQLVLGYISVLLLQDAGVNVTDQVNLGGTDAARAALTT